MTKSGLFVTNSGRKLAYSKYVRCGLNGFDRSIVFLGGFMSDMNGVKALHLEDWAKTNDYNFLRFDYSGHGQSSGSFSDGCISDWTEDSKEIIDNLTSGKQILVGSSMGGWISLLLAQFLRNKIAGIVGIAAAPDFTEGKIFRDLSDREKNILFRDGKIEVPSNYSEKPYIITKKLIEDGRNNLVTNKPISVSYPVRLLQGTLDEEVELSVATSLLNNISGKDVTLNLVRGAGHQFSDSQCLEIIEDAILNIFKVNQLNYCI